MSRKFNFSEIVEELQFQNNLIVAVVQDIKSKDVLMVAYMNKDSIKKTIKSGKAHFWSRSREKIWKKGEKSGNTQNVHEICMDCDGDALLLKVEQKGGACHKGYRSCFYRNISEDKIKITEERIFNPKKVYGE